MEAGLTYEEFVQQMNSKFRVQHEQFGDVELELTEVSDVKLLGNQEQFAVVFRGPLEAFLGQATHPVAHEQMGNFELFLVPVSQDANGFNYEAVFNRFR